MAELVGNDLNIEQTNGVLTFQQKFKSYRQNLLNCHNPKNT